MAGYEAILRIKVIADASQAAAGLDKAEAAGGKFGKAMSKAALPAAAAGAAVLAFGKKAVDSASKLQQSQGAVETVFGAYSDAVEKSARAAGKSMGLSAADYNNYASLVGTALQNAGMSVEQSVKASNDVMQRGADLSALYGGTTAEAVEAINAAVSRSEFDPLEKYGVTLNQTAINAELAARGQDKLTGAALETAKKQAALDLVFKKSAKAQGQYAREADSAAGSQQSMQAAWENASAALGTILLPLVAAAAQAFGNMAKWAEKNTTTIQILAGAIFLIATAVLVVNAALKVYQATMIVVQAVQKATWLSNPIFLVIAAVILLVAGIILLWKRSSAFRAFVLGMWAAIRAAAVAVARAVSSAWTATWNALKAAAAATGAFFRSVWNGIRSAAAAVAGAVRGAWAGVSGFFRDLAAKIRNALVGAFDAMKRAASGVANAIANPFDTIKRAVEGVIGAIKSLIGWLGKIKVPKISLPKIPGLRSVVPSAAAAGPTALSAGAPTVRGLSATPTALRATTASAAGGVVININGAIDPEGTARQVRRMLLGFDVRHSTPTAARGLRTV